ncbi:hypothetical protein R1flu_027733 [Riccia fluitans]|uniref:Uncharacterized protein n=1 Tax=Riccia fluitans TaxID=41844 RepID=A0ABD1XK52_9MARC
MEMASLGPGFVRGARALGLGHDALLDMRWVVSVIPCAPIAPARRFLLPSFGHTFFQHIEWSHASVHAKGKRILSTKPRGLSLYLLWMQAD